MFCDPDDSFDKCALEISYNAIDNSNLDVVQFAYVYEYPDGSLGGYGNSSLIDKTYRFTNTEIKKNFLVYGEASLECWNKIYRVDKVKKFGARFYEHGMYEETPFVYPLLTAIDSIGFIPNVLYRYYQRSDSQFNSKDYTIEHLQHNIRSSEQMMEKLKQSDDWKAYKDEIDLFFYKTYIMGTFQMAASHGIQIPVWLYERMRTKLFEYVGKPIQSRYWEADSFAGQLADILMYENLPQSEIDSIVEAF